MLYLIMRYVMGDHHGAVPKLACMRLLKQTPPRYSSMLSINATFQIIGRINPNQRVHRNVADMAAR